MRVVVFSKETFFNVIEKFILEKLILYLMLPRRVRQSMGAHQKVNIYSASATHSNPKPQLPKPKHKLLEPGTWSLRPGAWIMGPGFLPKQKRYSDLYEMLL